MKTDQLDKWPPRVQSHTVYAVLRAAKSRATTRRGQQDAIAWFIYYWLGRDVLRTKVLLLRDPERAEQLMRDALHFFEKERS